MSEIKITNEAILSMTIEEKIDFVNSALQRDTDDGVFTSILGLRLVAISEEGRNPKLSYTFDLDTIKMNSYRGLHGGLVSGEFDEAMGFAVYIYTGKKTTTASLTVDFLRAGLGGHYLLTVELDHQGRKILHTSAKLFDTDNDELCATAVGTFSVSGEFKQ